MQTKLIFALFFLSVKAFLPSIQTDLTSPSQVVSQPLKDWTFIIYAAARGVIAPYLEANLQALESGVSSKSTNFLAQVDSTTTPGINRYQIGQGTRELVFSAQEETTNLQQKIVDFVAWCHENYPAQNYCVIFSNCGSGAAGGVLFDDLNKTFLSVSQISSTLKKSSAILEQTINVVGFDACFMGGFEIACETRESANFMVAVEMLCHKNGWNYKQIGQLLSVQGSLTPEHLCESLVNSGTHEFVSHSQCSAIDLSKFGKAQSNLTALIHSINQASQNLQPFLVQCLVRARQGTAEIAKGLYVDLHTLLQNFAQELTKCSDSQIFQSAGQIHSLLELIQSTSSSLLDCILYQQNQAQIPLMGLSIYFPLKTQPLNHSSEKYLTPEISAQCYSKCLFAQSTDWLGLLALCNA